LSFVLPAARNAWRLTPALPRGMGTSGRPAYPRRRLLRLQHPAGRRFVHHKEFTCHFNVNF
jgi:hypothetical protein